MFLPQRLNEEENCKILKEVKARWSKKKPKATVKAHPTHYLEFLEMNDVQRFAEILLTVPSLLQPIKRVFNQLSQVLHASQNILEVTVPKV